MMLIYMTVHLPGGTLDYLTTFEVNGCRNYSITYHPHEHTATLLDRRSLRA